MTENPDKRILKSTSIIGGASILNILFKIIQSKVIAILLGPDGVGLLGLFSSVSSLATTIAGMGLGTSGVRAIADATGKDNPTHLARTARVFQRLTFLLAGIGGLSVFLLRDWISQITFGSTRYASSIGWLALAVFFLVLSMGQTALIRGVQRIGDLARVNVFGAAAGTLLGIPFIYWWGNQGVVFYLLGIAGMTLLVSWWFARKIQLEAVHLSWSEIQIQARPLLRLGIMFMGAGLLTTAGSYLVKVLLTRQAGVGAAGLYQAASMLANVYVGFILSAMGADFFPHLSSVAHNNQSSNELVNAQVRIGILLAVPGILAAMALGPWLLRFLYSAEFVQAFDIFRWQALGTFLRVVSWPLGFLLLAKEQGKLFLLTELAANLVYLGVTWIGLPIWGLTGVGIAFFALYLFYAVLMTGVARSLTGFRWNADIIRLLAWTSFVILTGFMLTYLPPSWWTTTMDLFLTVVGGLFALTSLRKLVGSETFYAYLERIKAPIKSFWSKSNDR